MTEEERMDALIATMATHIYISYMQITNPRQLSQAREMAVTEAVLLYKEVWRQRQPLENKS